MSILTVYRPPFDLGIVPPVTCYQAEGLSLAEMAAAIPELPAGFSEHGTICVGGQPTPRALWGSIRPKACMPSGVPVEVTFHAPVLGGGGGGEKSPGVIVASIILVAASAAISSGTLGTALGGSLFAAGSTSAAALAAGVGIVGGLLIKALTPPPALPNGALGGGQSDRNTRQLGAASASGNLIEPNGNIPRVIGTHRVFPPFATEPLVYYDGADEVVEAVFAFAGPHRLSDIKVSDAPIDQVEGLEFEVSEGWGGLPDLSLVTRYGRTEPLNDELRGHQVDDDDDKTLSAPSGEFEDALPQALTMATREAPDEVLLHLSFPRGLQKVDGPGNRMRVPFRLRLRPIGGDWINLPDLQFQARDLNERRATIKLRWVDDPTGGVSAASGRGWVHARILTPGQSVNPTTDDYQADPYFVDGSGSEDHLDISNAATTRVTNVTLGEFEADIRLDKAVFPQSGRYEIEIRRGYAFRSGDFVEPGYELGGETRDLFGYEGTGAPQIWQSKASIVDNVAAVRLVSVWNRQPVSRGGFALLAIRARNRSLERVSVLAGGYVQDWDGTAWQNWVVTSNPAAHLRDIYGGVLNADPVPQSLIDHEGLLAWREACDAAGYTVNAIIEGQSVATAALICASAGFARPYMSEIWGVTRDYDRTDEPPVQIFNQRNAAGFSWDKVFPKFPDGFRVSFADSAQNYDRRQISVWRDPSREVGGVLEQVTYEGLVTEDDVRARALFDLTAARKRNAIYSFEASAEAIRCRRGSLIGVAHNMLTRASTSTRVRQYRVDGSGLLSEVHLDSAVPTIERGDLSTITDLSEVADLSEVGARAGLVLRRTDGTITVHHVTAIGDEGDRLKLISPAPPDALEAGNLAQVGVLGDELLRLIVTDIEPRANMQFRISAVAEAPEIFTEAA